MARKRSRSGRTHLTGGGQQLPLPTVPSSPSRRGRRGYSATDRQARMARAYPCQYGDHDRCSGCAGCPQRCHELPPPGSGTRPAP